VRNPRSTTAVSGNGLNANSVNVASSVVVPSAPNQVDEAVVAHGA
jgi:hypothetical protein